MSKLCSLSEAVATIKPGSHVSIPGFAITRCAMAFAHEVVRQQINHLTISQCVGAMDADLLVGAGMVDKIIYGGGSLDRFGRLANVNRGIEEKTLIADEFSSLSVAFRYLAGALGLPFIPIRSIKGSSLLDLMQEKGSDDVAFVDDPFTGKNWLALKPIKPDVAIMHANVADEEGNAWIKGPKWDNGEQVKASERAIVIAERIVSTETIRQQPELTVIPGLFVSHVVELPFNAYPTAVYSEYDYDAEHIRLYVEASSSKEKFDQYIKEYILSCKDHWQFLDKIGAKKLTELRADPLKGY